MSFDRHDWLNLFIFFVHIYSIQSNLSVTNFNVTLKTPYKNSSPTDYVHKSIHVTYTLPDNIEQLNINGIEPSIQLHQKIIEQLTVRICNLRILRAIGYDDEIECDDEQSMLIYQWMPSASVLPFYLCNDCGFRLTRSQTIILTVNYKIEKRIHHEQSGVILYMSTNPIRFLMGTILIGNAQQGTHFSCRSSAPPRLLYAVKKLQFERDHFPWRIHNIRIRQFRRRLIQSVIDSEELSVRNQTNIEYLPADLFFIAGDYLLLQCENPLNHHCFFLLYYSYRTDIKQQENRCEKNQFPKLFESLPPRKIINDKQLLAAKSLPNIEASTVFLTILILLIVAWISIIIGCIIMRRIRGLVNFRTESSSPFSSQKNRFINGKRNSNAQFNQRSAEIEQVMQMDGEHGGVPN